jgi:hypothetical protein
MQREIDRSAAWDRVENAVYRIDPRADAGLLWFLHMIELGANDARPLLREWLTEQGPVAVARGKRPLWVRAHVRKMIDRDRNTWRVSEAGFNPGPRQWYPWNQWQSFRLFKSALAKYRLDHLIDHEGMADYGGLRCLVSEPYCDFDQTVGRMEEFQQVTGLVAEVVKHGTWFTGTVRVVIFPPTILASHDQSRRRRKVSL